jgi:hypothetical protein
MIRPPEKYPGLPDTLDQTNPGPFAPTLDRRRTKYSPLRNQAAVNHLRDQLASAVPNGDGSLTITIAPEHVDAVRLAFEPSASGGGGGSDRTLKYGILDPPSPTLIAKTPDLRKILDELKVHRGPFPGAKLGGEVK